jgi:hypothetical protein
MPVAKTISAVRKPAAASKLSPPQSEGLVSRSRLLKQLDLPCSVVTIVGPPLVGKTCLAASWMTSALASNRLFDMLRYRIVDTDQDVAAFFLADERREEEPETPSKRLPVGCQSRERAKWWGAASSGSLGPYSEGGRPWPSWYGG